MSKATLAPFNETKKAQQIYRNLWGGDDLHVGIYKPKKLSLHEAGRKTTERMLRFMPRIKRATKLLVLQSGFGTAARYIAQQKKCKVWCLNDDKVQNAYNQGRIDELELSKAVQVDQGGVEYMPYQPNYFDFIMAQDSFSITASKRKMFRAIHRVLKPEGRLVFTALMRSEGMTKKAEEMVDKLPVEELATLSQYEEDARRGFFQHVYTLDLSAHLQTHFKKVLATLEDQKEALIVQSSKKFVGRRIKTYERFLKLAKDEQLEWGILVFQKLNA
ncbi:MAG: methyltransferase domain-containing protein [Bacteroidota bacterium]